MVPPRLSLVRHINDNVPQGEAAVEGADRDEAASRIDPELSGLAALASTDRREKLANSYAAIDRHETRLRWRVEEGLAALGDRVISYSRAGHRTPTLFTSLPGRATWDAYEFLAARNVLAPAGSFYAHETFVRLCEHHRIGDEGGLRIGLAPYTTDDDIDRLLDGLGEFVS